MARVLIVGYGPLPTAGATCITAATLRTRQIMTAVGEGGHTVNLFTLPIPGSEKSTPDVPSMLPATYEGLSYQQFSHHSGEFAIKMLSEQVERLNPDAVVGVNTYPCYIAAQVAGALPFWADFNGYWMAEIQGRCWLDGDDARLHDAWAIERAVVRRLDKFSAISRPQLHATLGELAAAGRLNQFTYQYPFGAHLPNAIHHWASQAMETDQGGPVLRGPIVPADAFIILWSGGFHAWCDIPTLVEAVNRLMKHYPDVHLVATGGPIPGTTSEVYNLFQDLIDQSPYKDRYHLLGWVEAKRLHSILNEADLGMNVDAANYETMMGARARINAMASQSLAIATTIGTEISEWLEDARAVLAAPIGDPEALAAAIEPWVEQREGLHGFARNARKLMEKEFSYERTARKLLDWLYEPSLAPDNAEKLRRHPERADDLGAVALNALERESVMVGRHPVDDLESALEAWESAQSKRSFLFGLRRR